MRSTKKILQGYFWTTTVNLLNVVYGFVSVPLLISYFGKSNYGLIGIAMSVNVYLQLMDLGFSSTNIRYFSNSIAKKDNTRVNELFQTSLWLYGIIGAINAIVLLIVAYFAETIFGLDDNDAIVIRHLFYILSISAFVSWFTSCFDQLIRGSEYVGWTQKISIVPKLLQIVILAVTLVVGLNIESYYALTTFSLFILIPLLINKIRSLHPYLSFIPRCHHKIFKEILPYSLNVFSFGFFQFSLYNLRSVFLGIQGSPEDVADYSIINGIYNVVILLGGSFLGVILPSASKSVATGDKTAQDKIAYQGTKYISIALCLCSFGLISVSPDLLTLYVGKDFLYLCMWLDLLLLVGIGNHNQGISSLILAGTDIRAITYISIFSSVVGLFLCWLLIPYLGIGATVVSLLFYTVSQLSFYYLYYFPQKMRINSKRVFFASFVPYALIGACSAYIVRVTTVSPYEWINLIAKGVLFVFLFFFGVWLMIDKTDKEFIRSFSREKVGLKNDAVK